MLSTWRVTPLAAGAFLLAFPACNGGGDSGLPYCPPIANAGPDQSVTLGTSVALDGSASGYDANCQTQELLYTWRVDAVPAGSEVDDSYLTENASAAAVATGLTPDVVGSYALALVVCDAQECSPADVVIITVAAGDAAPVANAGPDVTTRAGERVDLDGSASSDPEGAELGYDWTLTEAPSCSTLSVSDVYNGTTAQPSLIPDCEGTYVVSLVVNDGVHYSSPDYAAIFAGSENSAPFADAGEAATVPPCDGATIRLNGFGSYDLDGDPIVWQWSLVSVPKGSKATAANFSDATVGDPTFTWDVVGNYSFLLQVYDGFTWSAPDLVTHTTQEGTANSPPIANAGKDVTMAANGACTDLGSYVFDCEDCDAEDSTLDGSGTYDPDGDILTYQWSETSGDIKIDNPTVAVTRIEGRSLTAEYGVENKRDYTLTLDVADCELTDSDKITVSLTCTGVN